MPEEQNGAGSGVGASAAADAVPLQDAHRTHANLRIRVQWAYKAQENVPTEWAGATVCEHRPTLEGQRKANQKGMTIFFRRWNRPFFFGGVTVADWS